LTKRNPALKKDPPRSPPVKTGVAIAALGLLLIVTAVTLLPTLNNGFVNWDDDLMVTKNYKVLHLSASGIKTIFTTFDITTYVPLTILTYAIEYRLAGFNPRVFHTTNYLLHLVNCLLVFWLILLIARDLKVALITALLFGVHPLHVESVAWITERKDVLYSLFFLAGLILYLRYQALRKTYLYVLAVASFLFSLFAKPMAMTFPFILLLLDYLRKRKLDRSSIKEKIPFFGLSLVFILINVMYPESLQYPIQRYLQHIFIFGYNIFFYLSRTVLPVNLSALHPYPVNLPTIQLSYLGCLALVIALAVVLYRYARTNRVVIFGALFFFITILPVSQLMPLVGPIMVSERFTYIPSLGLFFLISTGFARLYEKKAAVSQRYLLVILAAGIIATCAFLSHRRAYVWKDSYVLWNDVLAKYPNHPVPYNNLGTLYYDKGDLDRALDFFEKSIALKSDYADAYNNRGLIDMKKGMLDQALEDFTLAIKYKPKNFSSYNARGVAYYQMQDLTRAAADFNEAIKLQPAEYESYNNLGNVYLSRGRYAEAIAAYRRSLDINPGYAEANYNLGSTYYLQGDYRPAIDYLTAGIKVDPRYVQCYYNRGTVYYALEQYPAALSDYNRVLELNPENAGAYYNLALTYYALGDLDQARQNLETSIRLGFAVDPDAAAKIRGGEKK
jgi:tetratricopeptide (TPR) repeat protein